MDKEKFNENDVRKLYKFLGHEKETEIRIINPKNPKDVQSFFITNEDEFVERCKKYNGKYNLYAGINERDSKGKSANDVLSVSSIFLDIDAPRKDSKQPATNEELKIAEEIKDKIINSVKKAKQPEPISIFTGNGYQIGFRIPKLTITNDNRKEIEKQLQLFQKRIQDLYSSDNAIDNIGDLPRIIKIVGTFNVKGEESEKRPHRLSKFLNDVTKENKPLIEDILKLKEQKISVPDINPIEELNLKALPKCINYLYNEHKFTSPNGWMRTVNTLAAFFRGIGLSEEKTINLILEWNSRQAYHEAGEEKEINLIVKGVFNKEIFCANCKKIRTESSGFPYGGLKDMFKGTKLGRCCGNYINPITYYNAKTKPQKKESIEVNSFIFDDNEIIKKKPFPMHTIIEEDEELFGYGIKLPREEDIYSKDGSIIGRKQRWRPVIVFENGLKVYSEEFIKKTKTDYEAFPTENTLRWSLNSIKKHVDKKLNRVDKKEIFNKIKNQYQKFMFFREEEWYEVHTLWDIGTYFFMLFSHYPIIELRGIMGTAKTKVMTLSSYITFNSVETMVNPSEATLFRLTHELRPTKYIDEVENLFVYNKSSGQYEPDPRAQLINESYHKGGKVPRQEKFGNRYKTIFYHVYSPTMIGGIAGLRGATESRAITNIMTKNPKNDKRGNLEVEDDKENSIWQEIRNDLYILGLQNWKEVLEQKDKIDYSKIKGRNKQLWQPLLMIAKWIDEEIYLRIKKFAELLSDQKTKDIIGEGTLDYLLLELLRDIIFFNYTTNEGVDGNKIYLHMIKERIGNKDEKFSRLASKTISSHLDRLGFKNCRYKDTNKGSYFEITKKMFNDIVEPIDEVLMIGGKNNEDRN